MRKFKRVYIEITNICNLECDFCPKTSRKLKFMDEGSFEHILKSVKPYSDYVYFHLMGEPFLNSNLKKFLALSEKYEVKANITTNGTLINNVKDILIKSPALRQVNISLHSFEANNKEIKFEEYIENIITFCEEATEKSNIICSLRLWNLDTRYKASNNMNIDIYDILEERFNLDYNLKDILREKNSAKLSKKYIFKYGGKI